VRVELRGNLDELSYTTLAFTLLNPLDVFAAGEWMSVLLSSVSLMAASAISVGRICKPLTDWMIKFRFLFTFPPRRKTPRAIRITLSLGPTSDAISSVVDYRLTPAYSG
jgi:hypothetical protein